MDLLILVLGLAVVGFLVWVITTHIPMDPIFKNVIVVVVVLALVLYLLQRFGGGVPNVL